MALLYLTMLHMHETYVEDVLTIKAIIATTCFFFFKAITAIAWGNFLKKNKRFNNTNIYMLHACELDDLKTIIKIKSDY